MGWPGGEIASDEYREAAWGRGGREGRGDEKPEGNSGDLENWDKNKSEEVKKEQWRGEKKKKNQLFSTKDFQRKCLLTNNDILHCILA